jgi:hypothetical protein
MPHAARVSPVYESEEDYQDGDCESADNEEDYTENDYSAVHDHHNGEAYLVTDFYHQPIPLGSVPVSSAGYGVGVGGGGSDSGPEYSQPWASTITPIPPHSPNSLRHVFSPAPSAFYTSGGGGGGGVGNKHKPRMGVMATMSHNDKVTSSVTASPSCNSPKPPPPCVPGLENYVNHAAGKPVNYVNQYASDGVGGSGVDLRTFHPAGHLEHLLDPASAAALRLSHEELDSPVYDSTQVSSWARAVCKE